MNMHKNTRLIPHHRQAIWLAYTQEKEKRDFSCPPLYGQPGDHLPRTERRPGSAAQATN